MDENRIQEVERFQIAQIRELEFKELQVEELEEDDDSLLLNEELNAM